MGRSSQQIALSLLILHRLSSGCVPTRVLACLLANAIVCPRIKRPKAPPPGPACQSRAGWRGTNPAPVASRHAWILASVHAGRPLAPALNQRRVKLNSRSCFSDERGSVLARSLARWQAGEQREPNSRAEALQKDRLKGTFHAVFKLLLP